MFRLISLISIVLSSFLALHSHAMTCEEMIALLDQNSSEVSAPKLGLFSSLRAVSGLPSTETKIQNQVSDLRSGRASFESVYVDLGKNLAQLKERAQPYIPYYIDQGLRNSGAAADIETHGVQPRNVIVANELGYALYNIAAQSPANSEIIFRELLKRSLDPDAEPGQREFAQMVYYRSSHRIPGKPGDDTILIHPESVRALTKIIGDSGATSAKDEAIQRHALQQLSKLSVSHIEKMVQKNDKHFPNGLWSKFFYVGNMPHIPSSDLAITISAFENALNRPGLAKEAAVGLAFLAADGTYKASPETWQRIKRISTEGRQSKDLWTAYYSDLALSVYDVIHGKKPNTNFVLGNHSTPESVAKSEAHEAAKVANREARYSAMPKWPLEDRAEYVGKNVTVYLKNNMPGTTNRQVSGTLSTQGGIVLMAAKPGPNESAAVFGIHQGTGNSYGFDTSQVERVEFEGKTIFSAK